jgi:hypothetical protein
MRTTGRHRQSWADPPKPPDQAAEWQIQQPNKIFIALIFSIPILLLV